MKPRGNLDAHTQLEAAICPRPTWSLVQVVFTIVFLVLGTAFAFSQTASSPYVGGAGDGYASRFSKVSAVRQAIAPAWVIAYPSPLQAGGILNVLVLDVREEVFVTLFDMQGKHVVSVRKAKVFGDTHVQLKTTVLAAGMYCLQVRRDEDQAITQKIIVWGK
jgi:hypothetical protein